MAGDRFTRQYSQRLGVLTGEQLQAALTRFSLGDLRAAEPAPGGLFGQNVFLTTTSGEYVLRGDPHTPTQLQKERFFARLIAEETPLPAPWPSHIDEGADIFGWPYALMPRLEGEQIGDPDLRKSLDQPGRIALARALGEGLADLQTLRRHRHAMWDPERDQLVDVDEPYAPWFSSWTRFWLDACRKASDATTEGDLAWVEDIIAAAHVPLAEPFEATIVHTDYKAGNLVARRTETGWQVCGVFDLGELYMGDGEYDLARTAAELWLERSGLEREFVGAYAARRPPRPGEHERFRLYMLHDRLIIWEYGQRNRVWFRPGMTLRQFAEPFVEMAVW